MNDVIKLIKESMSSVDEYGDKVYTSTSRDVFAEVASIGVKEFYQAQATGLSPTIKFIIADYYDYDGEMLVRWSNTDYRVLRTYRSGQRLELTCYKDVNTGGTT